MPFGSFRGFGGRAPKISREFPQFLGPNFPGFFLLVTKFQDPPGFVLILGRVKFPQFLQIPSNSLKFPPNSPNFSKFPPKFPQISPICVLAGLRNLIYFHLFPLIFIDFHRFSLISPQNSPSPRPFPPPRELPENFWVFLGLRRTPKFISELGEFLISGV